jgi:hypothetical protein
MVQKVGGFVNEIVRNEGSSLGLGYPYVFHHNLEFYLIWHRETGEIVWVGEEGVLGAVGYNIAWHKCEEFNRVPAHSQDDLNAIDQVE